MLLGHFERAWKESDLLARHSGVQSLPGRVLVRCLRGLGDALQFLRYVPLLRRQCSWVGVQAPLALRPLLENLSDIDQLFPPGQPVEGAADYQAEIECSDLPYIFRTTLSSIPAELNLPGCNQKFRQPQKTRRIGVVWAAGSWNPERSISIDALLAAINAPGREIVSLQRNTSDREPFSCIPAGLLNAEPAVANLLNTARTIETLDLLITVDTMVAHLAGCLRKPVWTLLTFNSDWRWMLAGNTTPWYKSMRLFRQPTPGDWKTVTESVSSALKETQVRVLRLMREVQR
jgi:hypothetical protein